MTSLVLPALIVGACGGVSTSELDQPLEADHAIALFETADPAWAPQAIAVDDTSPIEVGSTFVPFVAGQVTAIQFYRGVADPGGYEVHLWTSTGALLATGVAAPSSALGWQTVALAAPVTLQPLQTYVASYYASAGGYAYDHDFFNQTLTRGPLLALGATGGETQPRPGGGVYRYGAGGGFPTDSYRNSNYWVGPVFLPDASAGAPPTVTGLRDITATTLTIDGTGFTPSAVAPSVWFGATRASLQVYSATQIQVAIPAHAPGTVHVRVLTYAGESAVSAADELTYAGAPTGVTATGMTDASVRVAWSAVAGATSYRVYRGTSPGTAAQIAATPNTAWNDTNGEGGLTRCQTYYYQVSAVTGTTESPRSSEVAVLVPCAPGSTYSAFAPSVTPANPVEPDAAAVELGVRFTTAVAGRVSAVRFYRGVAIPSGYAVHLWGPAGELLATGVAIEGQQPAPGWQTVTFAPVAIQPGQVYTASYYASTGGYAADVGGFAGDTSYASGPLTLLSANEAGGNGVYAYGPSGQLPTETYEDTNYYVDVVFTVD